MLSVQGPGSGRRPEFSFVYAGRRSSEFLTAWKLTTQTKRLDRNRVQTTETRLDPATNLEVRCVQIQYEDFPASEWTVYLKNRGRTDTPIVENLQAIDESFPLGENPILHHNVGSPANGDDYRPLETVLLPNETVRISAAGGRPTNSDLSYFNLASGDRGMIFVVGWPGQWAADFSTDPEHRTRIRAGQELTHFKLHAGEEVRTPLVVTLDWKGDWIDGQNQWRRWMMKYGMPHPYGKLPKPIMEASSSRAYREMIGANEANQIMSIDRYVEEGFKLDYWWMDAGWYVQDRGWPQVGTWEVDRKRFPNGLKPISDHAHAHGIKTLVWFEPERVAPNTWLSDNHPEWLLNPLKGLIARRSSTLGTNEPCVVFNSSDKPVDWNGIHWDARSLSFHPGPKGEYSVVRFTAPLSGEFTVESVFTGIDQNTTTDVHVLQQGRALFDSYIRLNGRGRETSHAQTIHLEKGDTLDFVVGYGNHDYSYDSTGLRAVVTGPDGIAHDAAKEYGKANWSYGYLQPGEHPDTSGFREYDREQTSGQTGDQLLDLGNSVARTWLTNHIDKLLTDNGIDLYRQDFNIDPLSFWRGNDAPDRQGITENHYVVGYLAYWDELRRRHPNMLIDSCASGGRRNDLETMRRAVPLWRSDYAYEPIGHQCMTYGISMWLPFHGTGTVADESAPYYGGGATPVHPYAFWSNAAPSLGSGIDIRSRQIVYSALRGLFEKWRSIGPYFYGDFYPLTPWTREDDNWIAWQFNRPEKRDGVILAFRRPKAPDNTAILKLRGLDSKATYRFEVIDGAETLSGSWSGAELMQTGLPIKMDHPPAAAVVRYSAVRA